MIERNAQRLRRATIATMAAATAFVLLRVHIAQALVDRGDVHLFRSDVTHALRYYRRAVMLAPDDSRVVDRFAFGAMLSGGVQDARESLDVTSAYLQVHPGDGAVLADRAFALRRVGRFSEAARAFDAAGTQLRDVRLIDLGAYAALRAGNAAMAHVLLRRCLTLQPSFRPAARALARL